MNSRILVVILSVAAASACVAEDPGAMVIVGNQRITREQNCVSQAGGGVQLFLTTGTLDLLQTNRYVAYLGVSSKLPPIALVTGKETSDFQLETNEVTVTGAWLSYLIERDSLRGPYYGDTGVDLDGDEIVDLPAGLTVPESIWVATSAFIGNGVSAVVSLEVVPPSVGLALDVDKAFDQLYAAGIMSVEIVLEGFLSDGTQVHSTPYTYPIKVCRGCLVSYNRPAAKCCDFIVQPTYTPCLPGQDEASPCNVACDVLRNSVREEQKLRMLLGETNTLADPLPTAQ